MTKTIPEMSVDTRLIYQHLSKMKVGDTASYSDLGQLIGRDVQNGARSNLQSAIRACLNDGLVFGTIRTQGVKRLADDEMIAIGESALGSIRRKARRSARAMLQADLAKLPVAQRTRHAAVQSALGVVSMFSKEKSIARIASKNDGAELPIAKTLEMFK
jgi:hypothetical protein